MKMIMSMLILIMLFLLSNIQNCMFPSSFYEQKTIKKYQKCLANDLKDLFIGINESKK